MTSKKLRDANTQGNAICYKSDTSKTIWTYSAISCYMDYCNCEKCTIAHTIETTCKMKDTVQQLIRTIGSPTKADCERVRIPYERFQQTRDAQILDE